MISVVSLWIICQESMNQCPLTHIPVDLIVKAVMINTKYRGVNIDHTLMAIRDFSLYPSSFEGSC